MKHKILLVLIVCVELYSLLHWLHCQDFLGRFHFAPFDLSLRLTDAIHNDQNVPLWIVRLFHNKFAGSLFDIFAEYMEFWNVSFLASFISLAGVVGLGAQFYNFLTLKKKGRDDWIVFGYLVLVPFLEIFQIGHLPFIARLILIAIPFVVWSTFGYYYLLNKVKLNSKMIDLILIISVWYQLAVPTLMLFCAVK